MVSSQVSEYAIRISFYSFLSKVSSEMIRHLIQTVLKLLAGTISALDAPSKEARNFNQSSDPASTLQSSLA